MNTNLNIQYQGLLNRNIGTSIETEDLTVTNMVCNNTTTDYITCIDLTSSGTITAHTTNINGKLTATNDPDSVVSNSNSTMVVGVSTGSYIIPLVSNSGGTGFRTLYNDTALTYNSSTSELACGKATLTGGVNIGSGSSYKINSVAITTSNVPEGSNLYYTDTRTRLAISLSSVGSEIAASYDNSTGIITIPPITANSVAVSKILKGTVNQFLQTGSALINNWVSLSGDATLSNGIMTIGSGAITPAKISVGSAGQILQTNGSLNNVWVTVTGDTIISTTGYTTISNDAITTVKVLSGAITPAKMSNGTAVGQVLLTGVSPYTLAYQTLNTSIVPELTNLYYTDTRARASVSGTAPIIYNNTTGAISLNTTIAQATTFSSSTPLVTNSIKIKDLNYISITDTTTNIDYFKADYTGVNIGLGLTYQIDGVSLKTSDIGELINLYYTNARARLAISLSSVGSEIAASYNNSTGIITIPAITANSIAVSKILKGTANQFLQTSSALVNTWVTMSGGGSLLNGVLSLDTNSVINAMLGAYLSGVSSITTALSTTTNYISSLTPTLVIGNSASTDGVFIIGSSQPVLHGQYYGTCYQNNNSNTFIDNRASNTSFGLGRYINIGTITPNQIVSFGSNTTGSTVQFAGGKFNNINKATLNPCAFTTSIPLTWIAVQHTATSVYLSNSITMRTTNNIKITVNISLNNWGTAASNHHLGLARATTNSFGSVSYDIITQSGTGSAYGNQHALSGIQYQSCNFTYIDNVSTNVAGSTYWYCVIVRSNSVASVSSNIGNNAYADITLEEMF